MLKFLAVFGLIAGTAFAGNLEKVCENSIGHNPEMPSQVYSNAPVFGGGLLSIRGAGGAYLIQDMEGNVLNTIQVPVKGLLKIGNSIWALAPFDLIQMNEKGEIQNTFNFEPTMNQDWGALSMTSHNDMIIITRGVGGILGFDMKTSAVKWTNFMTGNDDGYPSGIANVEGNIYAAAATSMSQGFTGIIKINPETGVIEKRAPYHREWGVMDTDAKANAFNGDLVVNNGGWIHKITMKQIESGKAFKPRWVAKMIQANGDVNAHYLMYNGDFFFEGNDLVGCGLYMDQQDGSLVRKSKVFKTPMP